MISYTDGKYSNYWNDIVKSKKNDKSFELELARQLTLLFPESVIPNPNWITHHYWKNGACYWKPGVDAFKMMKQILKPINNHNIFVANSNFNIKQAWIEGGLNSSMKLMPYI